jgi:outer membrane protein assembly factor BamB
VIRSTGSDGKVVQFFATPATPRNGIDGFTIETNRSATSNVIGIYVFQSSPLIRNNVIRAGSSGGPVVYGIRIRVTPSSPVIENNRIELVDGSSAEPTSGFAVQNATNNTEGHILLRNNEIDGGTVEFANRLRLVSNRASGSSMTIENNTITGGVASGDDAYSLYLLNGSNTVRGNTITGPTSAVTRVILAVGEDTVLTGNTLIGGDATASPSESTVLQLSGSNVLVRDNVITLGSGSGRVYGIVAYPDENNIRVDRNTIVAPSADGSQSGVGLWIRERSDIRFSNNLVYRRAGGTRGFTGILSWGASPLVYNNTFVTSNSQGGWTGIRSEVYPANTSNKSNPDIRNNIFAATVSGLSNATAIVSEDESTQSESTPAVVRSNAFYQLSGLMRIGSSAALTAEADLNDESKTTLRADGTAEGNLVANPAFTDAANEDFSLSASAPASVSSGGSDLSARSIVVDRNGLFRSSDGNGAGYSMGAFESDGVTEGPGPVTNLSAEDGVDQVRLTWTDPSSAFDSVEVSWEPGGSVPEVIDPGIQELVISDLADGSGESEYSFTVQAVTDGGVRSLPRHATATVFDPGSLRWSTETGEKVRSSPAIGGDGTVYIGSYDGDIYALDPDDGSTIWSRGTRNVVFGMPALRADGTVFVGSFSGTLYGFDAADGSDVGSRELNSGILASPAIASDGTVYIGAQNGIFYAVEADLAGGSIAWSVDTNMDGVSSKVRSSAAVGADGTVYVASQQTGIAYAIDSSDGSELWSADIGSGILGSPALDSDGTVYIGSGDTDLYALNPSDGSVVWRFETGGAIHASPTVGTGGVVYIGSKDGKFYAVNTSDGSQAWVRTLDDGINSSAALGDNGRLYVGTAAGTVYALEASDGSVAWTYATGNSIWFSSPAIGTDGTVYIGSEDKSVYALRSTAGGLADTAWPRFGGDLLGTRRME